MQRANIEQRAAVGQEAETESSSKYHLSAPAKGRWVYKTHSPIQEAEQMSYSEASTCENAKENTRTRHPFSRSAPGQGGSHTSQMPRGGGECRLGILPGDTKYLHENTALRYWAELSCSEDQNLIFPFYLLQNQICYYQNSKSTWTLLCKCSKSEITTQL